MTTARLASAHRITRFRNLRALGTCALLLVVVGAGAGPAAAEKRDSIPPVYGGSSTRHEPGWVPYADPESASVVIGRRVNAPIIRKPFVGGTRSMAEMGRAVCRALHQRAADSLFALCVHDDEFRDILWREFPQSRPALGIDWQDAWLVLFGRLHGGSIAAVNDWGGHYYEFLRWEHNARPDTLVRYKNFKLHNGMILVAKDDQGEIQRFPWLRSIAERRGVFKIYSMQD